MDFIRFLVAIPAIIVGSAFMILLSVKLTGVSDKTNKRLEQFLLGLIGVFLLKFWDILFFGVSYNKGDEFIHGWMPLIISLAYYALIIKYVRRKIHKKVDIPET